MIKFTLEIFANSLAFPKKHLSQIYPVLTSILFQRAINESAKLLASCAHMPTCLACLHAHVPTYLVCFRAHLAKCLTSLLAKEQTRFVCLRANVPCLLSNYRANVLSLRAYVLMYQRAMRAYVLPCYNFK